MEKLEQLSLENICGGAVHEVFERELGEILDNIADLNTDPEKKRVITFEFVFEPFHDRSGSTVTFTCKSKAAPIIPVEGTVFFGKAAGKPVAYPRNPRQEALFTEPPASEAKQ